MMLVSIHCHIDVSKTKTRNNFFPTRLSTVRMQPTQQYVPGQSSLSFYSSRYQRPNDRPTERTSHPLYHITSYRHGESLEERRRRQEKEKEEKEKR